MQPKQVAAKVFVDEAIQSAELDKETCVARTVHEDISLISKEVKNSLQSSLQKLEHSFPPEIKFNQDKTILLHHKNKPDGFCDKAIYLGTMIGSDRDCKEQIQKDWQENKKILTYQISRSNGKWST